MSKKNIILGFSAAILGIGSAIAAVMEEGPYYAMGAWGATRDLGHITPCPIFGPNVCRVKLTTSSEPSRTILGYTMATVFSSATDMVVYCNTTLIRTVIIDD